MANVTVLGPNLPRKLADAGTLHVHAAGCADIQRTYGRIAVDAWTIDAVDVAEVIEAIYPASDFDYDPTDASAYAGYRNDVKVFPCVKLPEQAS